MTEMFLVFEEDTRKKKKEIPVIVRGDMNDATVAHYISEARKAVAKDFNIRDLEKVIIVKDKIINFVVKQKKRKK